MLPSAHQLPLGAGSEIADPDSFFVSAIHIIDDLFIVGGKAWGEDGRRYRCESPRRPVESHGCKLQFGYGRDEYEPA